MHWFSTNPEPVKNWHFCWKKSYFCVPLACCWLLLLGVLIVDKPSPIASSSQYCSTSSLWMCGPAQYHGWWPSVLWCCLALQWAGSPPPLVLACQHRPTSGFFQTSRLKSYKIVCLQKSAALSWSTPTASSGIIADKNMTWVINTPSSSDTPRWSLSWWLFVHDGFHVYQETS
jgi:hypothetical protein